MEGLERSIITLWALWRGGERYGGGIMIHIMRSMDTEREGRREWRKQRYQTHAFVFDTPYCMFMMDFLCASRRRYTLRDILNQNRCFFTLLISPLS
jgi:hypothetical protein